MPVIRLLFQLIVLGFSYLQWIAASFVDVWGQDTKPGQRKRYTWEEEAVANNRIRNAESKYRAPTRIQKGQFTKSQYRRDRVSKRMPNRYRANRSR